MTGLNTTGVGMMTRMRRERRVNTDEYRELLVTLATLLKQPQMQSLDIDNCPSAEAYQLIEAFLCTSTSIEQKLTIRVVEETKKEKDSEDDLENTSEEDEEEEEKEDESSKAEISDVMKSLMPPFSQPIPESSVKYKCLYMNSTGSGRRHDDCLHGGTVVSRSHTLFRTSIAEEGVVTQ